MSRRREMVAMGGDGFNDLAYLSYVDSSTVKIVESDWVVGADDSFEVKCYLSGTSGAGFFGFSSTNERFRVGGLLNGRNAFFQVSPLHVGGSISVVANDALTILSFGNYPNAFIRSSYHGTSSSGAKSSFTNPDNKTWNLVTMYDTYVVRKLYYEKIYRAGVLVRDFRAYKQGSDVGLKCKMTGLFVPFAGWAYNIDAANGGGYKLKCPRRSYRRSSRPSVRSWRTPLAWEVAA